MAKVVFPILLLHIIFAIPPSAAQSENTSGLEKACQKSSDVKSCMDVLNPYASQFEDNDPNKMGYAAISAALAEVQAMRAYMVRQTTDPETSEKERSALKECASTAGSSDSSLHMASQEFDEMKATAKDEERSVQKGDVLKMIGSAKIEQTACAKSLKKHKDLVGGEVVGEALRLADRSLLACSLAQVFVQ